MRYAITAATPYQMLNAINLVKNTLNNEIHVDLYYRDFSIQTSRILNHLNQTNLFDNIYPFNLVSKNNKIKYMYNDLIQATQPKTFINGLIGKSFNIATHNYDEISVTSGTEFELALIRTFPTAKCFAYDDGVGSYVGDLIHDHKLHYIWTLFGRKTSLINPQCIYVNNPRVCKTTLTNDIRGLMPLESAPNEYIDFIKWVFSYKTEDSSYQRKNIVFLSQPIAEINPKFGKITRDVITFLEKNFSNHYILRKHPRDNETYNVENQDLTNNMWELVCLNEIDNKNILIGISSTAQLIPKILYNKEPFIIFLYNLIQWENKQDVYKRFVETENLIREVYDRPEKIYTPTSLEQLWSIINSLEAKKHYD